MNADRFVAEVRTAAGLRNRDEALSAVRATMSTLRERLAGNEPNNLADQLPGEVAEPLRGTGGQDNFSLGEFYDRVAQKEGVGREEAVIHARAVGAVLQRAVTGGEWTMSVGNSRKSTRSFWGPDAPPLLVGSPSGATGGVAARQGQEDYGSDGEAGDTAGQRFMLRARKISGG